MSSISIKPIRQRDLDADAKLQQHYSEQDAVRIDSELAVTSRSVNGEPHHLIVHRVSCRLKRARTPLALVSVSQRWNEAKPCSTCQPSARQMRELSDYISERRDAERSTSVVEDTQHEPCLDDMSEQQHKLIELRASAAKVSELDAALIKLGVDPHAPVADVVPLTKRGKRNDKSRTRRHEQRPQITTQLTDELRAATDKIVDAVTTKRCVDCEQDVKLTSFPTSTSKGQIVRLDYCRKCRTVRNASKGVK